MPPIKLKVGQKFVYRALGSPCNDGVVYTIIDLGPEILRLMWTDDDRAQSVTYMVRTMLELIRSGHLVLIHDAEDRVHHCTVCLVPNEYQPSDFTCFKCRSGA